jgi:hypothetical protein
MNSTDLWTMRRLVAFRCQELKEAAERARANPRRHRQRRPAPAARATAYPAPTILGADLLERLAALVAFDDA